MGKINWGRVVLGGIVAWIVIGVVAAIQIPMFHGAFEAAFDALGGESDISDATMIMSGIPIQLMGGIMAVWLYAAIRPRYGPGPMTAAIAGLAVWLILSVGLLSIVMLTNLTLRSFAVLHGPSLITWIVATNAGAWVYKEDGGAEEGAAEEVLGGGAGPQPPAPPEPDAG